MIDEFRAAWRASRIARLRRKMQALANERDELRTDILEAKEQLRQLEQPGAPSGTVVQPQGFEVQR